MDFRAAVISVMGSVGDCSGERWNELIFQVAKLTGRQVDRFLLADITAVLKTL